VVAFKHIGIRVPNMRKAEEHYREIFAFEVIGRESLQDDGRWYSVPHGKGWKEIEAAGVDIMWIGLRRDDIRIALFPGDPEPERSLFCFGLTLTPDEVAEIRSRLPETLTIEVDTEKELTFVDDFGFRWQCFGSDLSTAGDLRGDWLDL
jgi:catechol 2,3-dioxygenase-like lactoylglutathione lyase family enzyme